MQGLTPICDEAGFDIFNPAQTSTAGMDPRGLKARFGVRLVFWGGGFVLSTIHNIQARVPAKNLVALFSELDRGGQYPLSAS